MWSLLLILVVSLVRVEMRVAKPSTRAELQGVLDSAQPGDTIQLRPLEYRGEFIIRRDSTPSHPITLVGDYNSTIISQGPSGILLRARNWILKSFKVSGAPIGVLVEGSHNSLEGLILQDVGQGIVVRGPDNKIKSCVISEASGGLIVERGGDRTIMQYNSINIEAPAIVVQEPTCCGFLDGNVANGLFEVKGNRYILKNNVANHGLHVTGCQNTLEGNVANGASFNKACPVRDLGGNVYRGTGPNDTDEPDNHPLEGNLNGDGFSNKSFNSGVSDFQESQGQFFQIRPTQSHEGQGGQSLATNLLGSQNGQSFPSSPQNQQGGQSFPSSPQSHQSGQSFPSSPKIPQGGQFFPSSPEGSQRGQSFPSSPLGQERGQSSPSSSQGSEGNSVTTSHQEAQGQSFAPGNPLSSHEGSRENGQGRPCRCTCYWE